MTNLVCVVFSREHTTGCKAYSFTTDECGIYGIYIANLVAESLRYFKAILKIRIFFSYPIAGATNEKDFLRERLDMLQMQKLVLFAKLDIVEHKVFETMVTDNDRQDRRLNNIKDRVSR